MLPEAYIFNILSQSSTETSTDAVSSGLPFPIVPVEFIWNKLTLISWPQSLAAITIASIFLLYGWRLFRLLVTMNFIYLGVILGRKTGAELGSAMWGGILGSISLGMLPYPFMKYCAAFLSGLAGAVIGAMIQRGITNSIEINLAGSAAIAGLVAGVFLAFTSFKNTVMLFTSLQGAIALLAGSISLLINETPLSAQVKQYVFDMPMILPALICVITLFGIYIQNKFLAVAGSWKMPADEGLKRN